MKSSFTYFRNIKHKMHFKMKLFLVLMQVDQLIYEFLQNTFI